MQESCTFGSMRGGLRKKLVYSTVIVIQMCILDFMKRHDKINNELI